MIQRKQTIFLFLAAVIGILSMCMQLATVSFEGLTTYRIFSLWATLSVVTIFLYKRRPLQAKLCMVNIFIMVLWFLSMIVVSKQLAPDAMNFHLEMASSFPAVVAILLFMARKGILADERLVRAADRIR